MLGSRKSEIDVYVDVLCKEIEIATQKIRLNERSVISIYFGGGTPTLLDEENLAKIIDTIRKHLNVVEGEPVTLTQKKANILKDMSKC